MSAEPSRRSSRAVAAAIALSLGLTGCAGRAALGTTSSPCFHALPAAADAVGHSGTLVGVRLEPVSRLHWLATRARLGSGKVCLVAFRGDYTPTSVRKPLTQTSGPYALVVAKPDGSDVLGTAVIRRLPQRFRHL